MAHNNPYNMGKLGGNPNSSGVPPAVNPLMPNNDQLKALAMQLAAQNSQNTPYPQQLMAAATQQTGQSTSQQQQAANLAAASSPYLRGHPQLPGGLDQQMMAQAALMAQSGYPSIPHLQNPLLAAQMMAASANLPPSLYGQFAAAGSAPTPQDIMSRNYLMQMMANPAATALLAQQMMDPSLSSSSAQMAALMDMQRFNMTLSQMYGGLSGFPGTPSLEQMPNFPANPATPNNPTPAQASQHQSMHQQQKNKPPMMQQRTPVPPPVRRTPPQQLQRRENSQPPHQQQLKPAVKPTRNGSTGNVSSATSQSNVAAPQQQSHQRDSSAQRPDASRLVVNTLW